MDSRQETFQIEITADGSPTLRLAGPNGFGESMHNLRGALSETLYIYRLPIEMALGWILPEIRFFSMGLGLGYNELMVSALCLLHGQSEWKLVSFESVPLLRQAFLNWVTEQPPANENHRRLYAIYDQILDGLTEKLDLSQPFQFRQNLRTKLDEGSWMVEESFLPDTQVAFTCHAILYDAFSSNTSPDLWTETNLHRFLELVAAESCAFSTYAAKGALKRALTAKGFQLEKTSGFGGKRQSTFAYRRAK